MACKIRDTTVRGIFFSAGTQTGIPRTRIVEDLTAYLVGVIDHTADPPMYVRRRVNQILRKEKQRVRGKGIPSEKEFA